MGVTSGNGDDEIAAGTDVIFILDSSKSMKGYPLKNLKSAMLEYLNLAEKLDFKERISIITFVGGNTQVIQLTNDYNVLRTHINNLGASGSTPLGVALGDALQEYSNKARPVAVGTVQVLPRIIVVTNSTPDDINDALDRSIEMGERGIPIVCLGLPGNAEDTMKTMSLNSGGIFVKVRKNEDLESQLKMQLLLMVFVAKTAEDIAYLLDRTALKHLLEKYDEHPTEKLLDTFIELLKHVVQMNEHSSRSSYSLRQIPALRTPLTTTLNSSNINVRPNNLKRGSTTCTKTIAILASLLIATVISVFITVQWLHFGCDDLKVCFDCALSNACVSNFTIGATFYNVTHDKNFFRFNGTIIKNLDVFAGRTYTFAVQSPGQPFWIKTVLENGTENGFFLVQGNGVEQNTVSLIIPYIPKPYSLFYVSEYNTNMSGTIQIHPFIIQPDANTYLYLCSLVLLVLVACYWILHGENFLFVPTVGFIIAFWLIFLLCIWKATTIAQWTMITISAGGGIILGIVLALIAQNTIVLRIIHIIVGLMGGFLFTLLVLTLTPLFGLFPLVPMWFPLTCGIVAALLSLPSIKWDRYICFTSSLLGASIVSFLIDITWVYGAFSAYVSYWFECKFSYVVGDWQCYVLLGGCVFLTFLGTLFQIRYGFIPAYLRGIDCCCIKS